MNRFQLAERLALRLFPQAFPKAEESANLVIVGGDWAFSCNALRHGVIAACRKDLVNKASGAQLQHLNVNAHTLPLPCVYNASATCACVVVAIYT